MDFAAREPQRQPHSHTATLVVLYCMMGDGIFAIFSERSVAYAIPRLIPGVEVQSLSFQDIL